MSRLLIPINKRIRVTTLEQCLTILKSHPKEFLCRFVTVDETWIHRYKPATLDFTLEIYSEEGEDYRKVNGLDFQGFRCSDLHRLHGKSQNSHRATVSHFLGRFDAEQRQQCFHLT